MPELGKSGSVGATGGQLPVATRPRLLLLRPAAMLRNQTSRKPRKKHGWSLRLRNGSGKTVAGGSRMRK